MKFKPIFIKECKCFSSLPFKIWLYSYGPLVCNQIRKIVETYIFQMIQQLLFIHSFHDMMNKFMIIFSLLYFSKSKVGIESQILYSTDFIVFENFRKTDFGICFQIISVQFDFDEIFIKFSYLLTFLFCKYDRLLNMLLPSISQLLLSSKKRVIIAQ